MRECFSVADIIRYAAQHIGVVGDDAVYAPGDHIFHVLLVIYRPGVDLHAPAVEQFHQLRLILQKHIPVLVSGVHDPVLSGATNRFLSENRKPIDRIS